MILSLCCCVESLRDGSWDPSSSHLLSGFQGMSYRCYADDSQIYFTVKPSNLNQLSCSAATKDRMTLNFLLLSPEKPEGLLIGPDHFATAAGTAIGPHKYQENCQEPWCHV